MTPLDFLALAVAGILGGALNTAAAGGGVITFVACMVVGLPPQAAIATSQVAIPASFLGGIVPAWRQRGRYRPIVPVVIAAAVGTGLGVWLVSRLDAHTFRQWAPWLLVVAGLLLVVQPYLHRRLQRRDPHAEPRPPALPVEGARPPSPQPAPPRPVRVCELERREPAVTLGSRRQLALTAVLFVVALYGGGFGGGVGVAVLVALATLTGWTWETTNTVKIGLCLVMSLVCSGAFLLLTNLADLAAVVVLAGGQLLGGRLGVGVFTWLNNRLPERTLRRVLGTIIVVTTAFGAVAATGS